MASVTRTIEPGVSMFSAAEIRVAIVQIGPAPRDAHEAYLDALNRHRHVPLRDLRALHRPERKSPFAHTPWCGGALRLRFLPDGDARRRTRLAELHAGRAVLAVVGVVHCPLAEDLGGASLAEFGRACRAVPDALVRRCFAFAPGEAHEAAAAAAVAAGAAGARDLVLMPPPGAPPAELDARVRSFVRSLAAALLAEAEAWMLSATVAGVRLNTHLDSAEFAGSSLAQLQEGLQQKLNATEDELREKRRWGRLQKAKGDIALLAGSPRDALEHYRSGLELSRGAGDAVWAAAALEGVAHARVMDALSGGGGGGGDSPTRPGAAAAGNGGAAEAPQRPATPADDGGKASGANADADGGSNSCGPSAPPLPLRNGEMWRALRAAPGLEAEVASLMGEARGMLRRRGGALPLQIEGALQLARFLAGVRGPRAARPEGLDLLGGALEAVPQLPLLEDRLVALVETAQAMGLLGCGRKRQLLLWAAIDLSRAVDRSDTLALRIATRALEAPDTHEAQDPDDLPRRHWAQRREALPLFDPSRCPGGPWEAVRLAAAEAALAAARTANSPIEAWEAASLVLREHGPSLPPTRQAAVLEALAQAAARFPQRALARRGPGPAPVAHLRRVAPPPAALAPVRLGGGGAGAANAGPFIFNPYAARRERGAAAAAAQAAVAEWVAGDEGRVEVALANPLAVPLRLDGVALAVVAEEAGGVGGEGGSPTRRQQQHEEEDERTRRSSAGGGGGGGGGAPADVPAPAAQSGFAIAPSITGVTLPPGGKPVRLALPLTPTRPGELRITGVLVTAWGVTWEQPLTLLPRLAPLTAPGALRPQPPQHVRVLPRLPLLRATLAGPEVRLTVPSEADCGSGGGGGGKGSAAPGAALSPGGGGPSSTTAASASSAAAQHGLPGAKAAVVAVCEGQHLSWTLTLTNASDEHAVGACSLTVLGAKGQPLRGRAAAQLPASFAGVHVDAGAAEERLREALPLAPRCSVTLPLSLSVGRPPADSFEGAALELRIAYAPPAAAAAAAADATNALPEGTVGRRLSVPLRFAVQPTLAVAGVRFLQLSAPLCDGRRCGAPALASLAALSATTRDAPHRALSSARSLGGGIARNSSEGALLSPTSKAALVRQQQQQQLDGLGSEQSLSPTKRPSGAPSASAAAALAVAEAAAGARCLGVAAEAVLELSVRNRSGERYFRAWLARLPGSPGADGADSAVAVLEPGDDARLLCPLLPAAEADAASGGAPQRAALPAAEVGPRDAPQRLQCAERLAEAVGLRWEMITGDAMPDRLPRGIVRLAPVDIAHSLTPAALTALAPSRLHARVVVVAAPPDASGGGGDAGSGAPELVDASAAAQALGARLPGHAGPVWAVRVVVGRPLVLEVRVARSAGGGGEGGAEEGGEAVALSAVVSDLSAPAGPATGSADGVSPAAAGDGGGAICDGAPGGAGGLLLSGCYERAALVCPAGGAPAAHRLGALPLLPGLYQVGVACWAAGGGEGVGGVGVGAQPLYVTQDRLRLLVVEP